MEVLCWTRLGSTVIGQQELVDITIEQAELSVPFKHSSVEQLDRLTQCIKHALPHFNVSTSLKSIILIVQIQLKNFFYVTKYYIHWLQAQIDSSKYVSYICMQVLPHLSLISAPDGRDAQLIILKLLAEVVAFCGNVEKPEEKVQQLYNALIVSINVLMF